MNSSRTVYVFILAGILIIAAFPSSVSAAEIIHSFDVTAEVSSNRNVSITEKISYDFGAEERHGIYRLIPMTYVRNGTTYKLRLHPGKVTRDGTPNKVSISEQNGKLRLKIGDANKTITGTHIYVIPYTTDRVLNFFSNHDELYWNVTGNDWHVPIEQANFTVSLPPGTEMSSVSSTCFTGVVGSTEHDCSITQTAGGLKFTTDRVLEPNEGMTIVVDIPKGVITPPTIWDILWQILVDNGILFFPLAALIVMFMMWWRRGRDPRLGTVVPVYASPEHLTPALVGTIMTDGDVPAYTVTATIIDLARRGYLKIRFGETKGLLGVDKKKTYTFVKLKGIDGAMAGYEKALFNGLFKDDTKEVALGDLRKNMFYDSVVKYKKKVREIVDGMAIFSGNPMKVRGAYTTVAVLAAWVLFYFFGSTGFGTVAALVTGIIIFVFGMIMPKLTARGVKLLAAVKGFKWFLSVTEKDRLDFHNAPDQTSDQFMALLPFAIAFAVETKWATQFASLTIPPPSWTEGSVVSQMSAASFARSLNSLHTAAVASGYSAPSVSSSGGSGFFGGKSGGGGGGGSGGGSW